jgi:hypothetical protein
MITDPQGFAGDFMQKPGVRVLKAGEAFFARMDITLLET